MKKVALAAGLILLSAVLVFAFAGKAEGVNGNAYLRVHIRADSNDAAAQAVKYRVRDRVIEFLTPTVAECASKGEAMEKIGDRLEEIEAVAEAELKRSGFSYGAKASVRREEFPTRVYREVTLEAGVYDSLIIELGSGKGDNWWCVVYPPLCFAGGNGNVVYKSKILEIIGKFFGE